MFPLRPPTGALSRTALLALTLLSACGAPAAAEPAVFPDGGLDTLLRVEATTQDGRTTYRVRDDVEDPDPSYLVAEVDLAGSSPRAQAALPEIAAGADPHDEGPGLAYLMGTVTGGKLAVEAIGSPEIRQFSGALEGAEAQLKYCHWVAASSPSDLAIYLIRKSLAHLAESVTSLRSLAPLPSLRDRAQEIGRKAKHLHQQLGTDD